MSIALFWDGSFLFGLMAFWGLKQASIPFNLITAQDISKGALDNYDVLFVPGGWIKEKIDALGESGKEKICQFVKGGGNYLGICGGAGLALKVKGGLGLVEVERKESKNLANFSGKIKIKTTDHPIWSKLSSPSLYIFWPGHFKILEPDKIKILGYYDESEPDFFAADINTNDLRKYEDLKRWEDYYKIRLDPKLLKDKPAILEGRYRKGKVILSYLHFDTPNDEQGKRVLFNIWQYLSKKGKSKPKIITGPLISKDCLPFVEKLEGDLEEFIEFGKRSFIWYWRYPWMLGWRKGIRGFHYATLYVLIKEMAKCIRDLAGDKEDKEGIMIRENLKKLTEILPLFLESAKELLLKERYLLNFRSLSFMECDDPEIQSIRDELFGKTISYGGKLKEILGYIDNISLPILKSVSFLPFQFFKSH